MRAVPFFTDDLTLAVDTASRHCDVGRQISVREFTAPGYYAALYEAAPGRYKLVRRQSLHREYPDDLFIEGEMA